MDQESLLAAVFFGRRQMETQFHVLPDQPILASGTSTNLIYKLVNQSIDFAPQTAGEFMGSSGMTAKFG
jgi:hypothetical protein